MREVKFRAWDSLYKEWIDNVAINLDGTIMSYSSGIRDSRDPGTIKLVEYTGMKDKNGKEIYEGDILQWEDWEQELVEKPDVDEVLWFEPEARFALTTYRNGDAIESGRYLNGMDEFEIVGNIYENKDLLDE